MMINLYDFIGSEPSITKLECNDLLFVEYNCPIGRESMKVWSQQNYLLYVLSGEKRIGSPHRTWHLKQGEALFVKKGGSTIQPGADSGFCVLLFFVPDVFIRNLLREQYSFSDTGAPEESEPMISVKVDLSLASFFQSVVPYFSHPAHPPSKLLELKFKELILNIMISPENQELAAFFRGLAREEHPSLRRLMEANYNYNLSMEEFARLSHRSLSTFKRDFQSVFGTSPGKWLTAKRLERACRELRVSNRSIQEIASDCGFKNAAHFSRIFKEEYGVPPLKYRTTYLADHPSFSK